MANTQLPSHRLKTVVVSSPEKTDVPKPSFEKTEYIIHVKPLISSFPEHSKKSVYKPKKSRHFAVFRALVEVKC